MQRPFLVESRRMCVTSRLKFRQMSTRDYLGGLNGQQRRAVDFPPNNSLQILAGPGTGKTHVLTSRISELVLRHEHSPASICALTFTKKASNEMKARMQAYLGTESAKQLKLGTFHSVCIRYLRAYGPWAQVDPEFLIWGKEECKLLIKYISEGLLKGLSKKIPPEKLYDLVTEAKERARLNAHKAVEEVVEENFDFRSLGDSTNPENSDPLDSLGYITQIYSDYSQVLLRSNALDFSDILIKGLDLFQLRATPKEIGRLRHVLVDEFQDTNGIQYLIVKELFKATAGSISVVGDPDQSIYGWRGADNEVFEKMKLDLPQTMGIYLEQNYRSTSAIINFALDVISQDKMRPPKTLFTSRTPVGPKPTKKALLTYDMEATYITQEIKRLVENSDGVVGYGDCAILLRTKFIAKQVTPVLEAAGVPFRVLPERPLIDCPEVKNLIAFLRMIIKTSDTPMIIHSLEGPLGVGKEAIATLVRRSIKQKATLFQTLERLQSQADPDTTPSSIGPITLLIRLRKFLRARLDTGATPSELLQDVIEQTDYYTYLKKYGPKYKSCLYNVQRMMEFARMFPSGVSSSAASRVYAFLDFMRDGHRTWMDTRKVTLLTCHAAKGLEWPVVFIPRVIEGVFPHARSLAYDVKRNIDEERRLLYVACTRAQCLLYLTRPETKWEGRSGDKQQVKADESRFTRDIPLELCQDENPSIEGENLKLIKDLLRRGSKIETRVQSSQ